MAGPAPALGALAAGVPLVLVPMFADQFENARRIAAAGAGVVVADATGAPLDARRPIGRGAAPRIARAINAVLGDTSYRRRARAIAAEMAAAPTAEEVLGSLSVKMRA